jgi:hypothetical protein
MEQEIIPAKYDFMFKRLFGDRNHHPKQRRLSGLSESGKRHVGCLMKP